MRKEYEMHPTSDHRKAFRFDSNIATSPKYEIAWAMIKRAEKQYG